MTGPMATLMLQIHTVHLHHPAPAIQAIALLQVLQDQEVMWQMQIPENSTLQAATAYLKCLKEIKYSYQAGRML